ncbi:Phage capsid and scaffold protein [Enterobacterales bacterium 8AC]|nr:Phage capsid and scaffold protein [Enterobacterales bacterium 8AC]
MTVTPTQVLGTRLLKRQPGLDEARTTYDEKKAELDDINQVIKATQEKKRTAEEQCAFEHNDWRKTFRLSRGTLTPDLQDQHTQRVIQRELVNEYEGLLAELEEEREEAMSSCCYAARQYEDKHRATLRTYSEWVLHEALDKAAELIRAVALRWHALGQLSSDERHFHNSNLCARPAHELAMQEVTQGLLQRVQSYQVTTQDDALLEAIGLYTPDFSDLDRKLIDNPAARNKLNMKIAARRKAKAEAEKAQNAEKAAKEA